MKGQLVITDVSDFATPAGAAARIGVSVRTVNRMVREGILDRHYPRHDDTEKPPLLLSWAQVEQVRAARLLVGLTPADPRRDWAAPAQPAHR